MDSPNQQPHRHHEHPRLQTSNSGPSSRPPLTSSTLQELREGDASPQTTNPVSPMMSRRTSLDSDRFSMVSGLTSYFPNNPTNVNPQPAYVAPFGASQVVSENQPSRRRVSSDEEDDFKLNKDDVRFSKSALALVNAFLDQLLYSFLSTSRSTSLLALRPAVTEVLKHRLAKEAIASAEAELAELLAGDEDEDEMESKQKLAEKSRSWDLELIWKRTRLRVMVYMRLGEMEEDMEEKYVKEEELFHGSERRFSQSSGLVSWAAAIFLTSVLEYVAEQTLQVAGQAAETRVRRQSRAQRAANGATGVPAHDYLVVEEHDVEKVALNSALGRLWRSWRKALRTHNANATPTTPTHRSSASIGRASRENMVSAMSHRRSSFGTAHEGSVGGGSRPLSRDQNHDLTEDEYPEHVLASNIPLPMSNNIRDIDEIVVPGLARDPDDEEETAQAPDEPYSAFEMGALVPIPLADDQRDVDEIEVPGLARDPDAEDHDNETVTEKEVVRRNSFAGHMPFRTAHGLPTADSSSLTSPTQFATVPVERQRSTSLPTAARTPLLREDAAEKPAVEDVADDPQHEENERSPPAVEGAEDENSGSAFPWMAGGAAVVASATAAVGAWVIGSKDKEPEHPEQSEDSTDEQSVQEPQPADKRLSGLAGSANQGAGTKEESAKSKESLETLNDTSQQSRSDKDVEQLDKRKSLLDIKSMMIVNSSSGRGSGQESPQKPLSPMRSESSSSYALGNRGVSEEEGPDDAIGVARTADVPATVIPSGTVISTPNVDSQEARAASNRPARLVLSESSKTLDSPANQGQPLTPRTLQRQFLDLTAESQVPEEEGQDKSPRKQTQRASLSNGAQQQQPSVGSSPYRQSFTAPLEKDGAVGHQTKSSSDSPVQDHPVIQRMASLKSSEPKSPRSPKLASESEKTAPLTSASIRGPEDFDMFVQGVDTLKYTLTPENVRYEPGPSNVVYAGKGVSPVEMDAASSRVGRSAVPKQARPSTEEEDLRSSKRRSISRPSATNTSAHRKSGLMAREPRVLTESTRDFADFIRSTGPDKDRAVKPILPNASTTSLHSLRSAHINGAAASRSSSPSGDRRRSLSRPSGEGPAVPPVPPVPVPGRSKTTMQPRGAKSVTDGSADLIDFIRSGPEESGKHRISRTVAPFRTTMDSDQLNDLGDRVSNERSRDYRANNGISNTQSSSSLRSSSHRTSANSRSALLSGPTAANQSSQPAYSDQPQRLTGPVKNSQNSDKKRFRNKDPYAMYYMDDEDDDDEDFLTSLPQATHNEESLTDFLSNNEPPTSAAPQPLINPNSAQARNIINNARASGVTSQRSVSGPEGRARTMPNSAGPRSGYNSPAPSIPSRQGTMNGSMTSTGARPARMQARGGAKDISMNSNTRDLADFLKAGPPEDPESAPAPFVGRDTKTASREVEKAKKKAEKRRTGSGFFGRSKKKYLDMP